MSRRWARPSGGARRSLCAGWSAIATLLAAACAEQHTDSHLAAPADHPPGAWVDVRFEQRASLFTLEERAAFEALGAIGYVEGIYAPPQATGVVQWNAAATAPGYNLYCSGHGAEAFLIDMDGQTVHSWSYPRDRLPRGAAAEKALESCWRRVRLLADGSLIAIYEGLGIARIDAQSNLVWFQRNNAHHDLDLTPDGRLFVLSRASRLDPSVSPTLEYIDDFIIELDTNGVEYRRTSIAQALLSSRWAQLMRRTGKAGGDVLHTNTIEILRSDRPVPHPAFQPGRALVALRNLDAIAVVDLELGQVVWMQRGPWIAMHAPTVNEHGRILVFDNIGHEEYSRICSLDVPARTVETVYAGATPHDFFSIFCGAAQALPGGNLLITESYRGHAFEVTPAGDVVWEFLSPHRTGHGRELVAVLFEVQRLPAETLPWLTPIVRND